MATEADKYEGFRQKLENICDENGLLYTVSTEGYPITLTISPHMPAPGAEYDDDEGFIGRRFLRAFNATIRDGLVLTSFTEPGNCAAVLLIDLGKVHDIGCFFGITHDGRLGGVTITAMGGWGGNGLSAKEGYAKVVVDEE